MTIDYEFGELKTNGTVDAAKNSGNIAWQTLTVPGTSFVQTYKYDSLYRLTEVIEKTGGTTNWSQKFGYDRYENRGISTLSSLSDAQSQVDAWNRQAAINFIAGALSGYSMIVEFSGAANGMQAETDSNMFAMGQRAGTGGSLATLFTGTSFLNGAGKIAKEVLTGLRFANNASKITVLGKVGKYEQLAKDLGANAFIVPNDVWKAMSQEQRLAANAKFLDDAIAAGHEFVLSNRASEATRTFAWKYSIYWIMAMR